MEVADGGTVKMADLVWITVVVAKTTQVIAAVVVDGPKAPTYSLLLGKHWMKNVALIGYSEKDEYTIRTDASLRVPVPKTGDPSRPHLPRPLKVPTQAQPRWVEAEQSCMVKRAFLSSTSEDESDSSTSDYHVGSLDQLRRHTTDSDAETESEI
ncbi:uncharacterized protein N7500_003687 [Penicillium coprophilum]|uniref:uncharacterized protein n=1 Tax=Penicillium coprophilum TaxID=36646 RepID=UPI00238E50F3|nr:uncharacterized protein N7500_003687 [Penicillium coprophilum]KAJ5170904.1 hypothetical protein N7500_003687 [Penicillium coprophilum]